MNEIDLKIMARVEAACESFRYKHYKIKARRLYPWLEMELHVPLVVSVEDAKKELLPRMYGDGEWEVIVLSKNKKIKQIRRRKPKGVERKIR